MLWTVAEGAVYSDFDKDIHIVNEVNESIQTYYAGVDWGFSHYGAIVILGKSASGKTYLLDGCAKQGKHIDWWTNKAKEFIKKYGKMTFYCDSARSEHISDFIRKGIHAINANKSVVAGIEEVAKGWKNNTLFYVKGAVSRFEDEIYNYRWQENASEDKPIKEYDDVLDALRYGFYTHNNQKQGIETYRTWY